ncbi:Phosphoserine phosphatase [Handroanthus impetiginosus]|uniref:Phosphoserine phosphatase n=1 Tax=Handroanthus impetiginosus TaxID=429701 RepID=A0A2G9G3D7_9LAMI|nr:Phosphoserine phosphatase [Handroanthus impetiginosus]
MEMGEISSSPKEASTIFAFEEKPQSFSFSLSLQVGIYPCCYHQVAKDPDLRERHLGHLQGVPFDETDKVNPEAHKAFKSNRDDQEIPGCSHPPSPNFPFYRGGESRIQLYQYCTSALQRIAKKHIGERVVIISHGATIEALDRRAYPYWQCRGAPNASVSVFHVSNEDEWSSKSWADVSHLNQTGFLPLGFGGDEN